MTKALLIFIVISIVCIFGHSHSREPPHLKYTREVNEASQKGLYEEKHHGHSHGAGGCSDHHGHSHGHDDEEVEDLHAHSHSRDASSHSHGDENANAKSAKSALNAKRKEHTFAEDGMFAFLNDARTQLWVYSIGSTLLISAFPCFILAFIPIQGDTSENSSLLKFLLAFGAGGLLGDAFLHLIPHATPASDGGGPHSHSHSHGVGDGHAHAPHDMSVGQHVLTGFMIFFIVEKFVRIMRGEDGAHLHSHSHARPPSTAAAPAVVAEGRAQKAKHSDASEADSDASQASATKAAAAAVGRRRTPNKSTVAQEFPRIRVAAYLNLVADFMHNFTDGLAIGASFIAGSTVGVVTTITVLVHEVPHEIGDFAILVRSGYSKGQAMLIQLCTAAGALAGCVISLWSMDAYALAEAAGQNWVLPFTAGGFIYIATVSVIPELLERSTFWQSVRETCAIVLGVFLMYLIAFYE